MTQFPIKCPGYLSIGILFSWLFYSTQNRSTVFQENCVSRIASSLLVPCIFSPQDLETVNSLNPLLIQHDVQRSSFSLSRCFLAFALKKHLNPVTFPNVTTSLVQLIHKSQGVPEDTPDLVTFNGSRTKWKKALISWYPNVSCSLVKMECVQLAVDNIFR